MKNLENKVFYGQSTVLSTIVINGTKVQVADVDSEMKNNKITYTIPVKDTSHNIDAVLTAGFVVEKNTLAFNITDVKNNLDDDTYPIQTIDIPDQSLISVRSTQEGANFKGAVMSVDTAVSGDRGFKVADAEAGESSYMYGFVSNNDLSAGIWSNSEIGDREGGFDNNRITAETVDKGAYKTTGLKSSMWYYNRKITTNVNNQSQDYVVKSAEMPSTKVVIAGDENEDKQIDWQDGAIAFRDIMNNPVKCEEVPDLVAYRIAMNFGSQAQNPFLMTLDNVKKVALNTDGLGQSILLKGYANEGHDSGHPDYWDIGRRIGGADDMNTMMKKGAEYGARFGIHVNASEMYPEAKAFSNNLVRWNKTNELRYGWNWLDQGVGINALYDLGSGQRADRFKKLYDEVGNNLDFVYVDVWGNQTSGSEDAWQTRQLADEITSHGWRAANEWGYANEYDATFQHWATDLTYGDSTLKGINSEVMRFIRNHQKDSWVADYPSYGAAAQAPLLGGYSMKDFEGWQGRSDYDAYIKNLFAYDLSTKFIQHYQVTKWVDGEPVEMLNPDTGKMASYTPDKQITLKDADKNTVQITRKSTDPTNMDDYRTRTMKLNGTTILQGRANGGDYSSYQDGDEIYLIPWYWNANGEELDAKDQKLYHWNTKGGTTSWKLPTGWENVDSVKVYQLTDQGKTNEQTVSVNGGNITLTADAQTPYVVTKGSETNLTVEWSTGMHITDAGFNSGNLNNWTVTGDKNASVVKSMSANEMLKLSGESTLTQTLTNLKPGTQYAAYVGIDNRSDANASMTIKDANGKVLASNYSGKSIAKNYVSADPHSTNNGTVDGSSYFQNMYVFFTAPADGSAVTLTLSRAAGDGDSYFDNIRIVENASENIVAQNSNGDVTDFRQDFENTAQGIYPFVVGPVEGVTDNRTHLSERHDQYTQAGWNVKKTDDVLDGDWSVKTNGLTQRNNLVYQTVPQNFHFLPGVTYQVSFKYQSGSDKTYAVTYGSGEYKGGTTLKPLPAALGTTKEYTFTMVGDPSGLSWFGIYSTGTPADLQETADLEGTAVGAQDFGGYKDFMLDDLEIKVTNTQKGDLSAAIEQASSKVKADYTAETWEPFASALTAAQKVMDDPNASQQSIVNATTALIKETNALKKIVSTVSGIVTDDNGKGIPNATVTLNCSDISAQKAITNADGKYTFKDIFVRDYSATVSADGYETLYNVKVAPKSGSTITKDFKLSNQASAQYSNTFESGDISSIDQLAGNPKPVTAEAVEIGGNGALKISFPGGLANIVDTAAPKFKKGTFEADVTPLDSGVRFGFTLRGTDMNNRLYVGCGDSDDQWFVEYWGGTDENKWSNMYSGPALTAGTTRHIKVQLTDTNVSLWVDGQQVINALSRPNMPASAGYVGFECWSSNQFIIDNLAVTSDDTPAAGGHNVTGSIKSGTNALAGASVALKDNSDKVIARLNTGFDGSYTFTNVPSGTYTVIAEKDGYVTSKGASIDVADSDTTVSEIVLAPDSSSLRDFYNTNKDMKNDGYTSDSWNNFQTALKAAKTVLDNDKAASAVEISKAYSDLQNAINSLTQTINPEALQALYDSHKKDQGSKNPKYTDEAWQAYQNALIYAQFVLENPNAGNLRVAESNLQSAIAGLNKMAVNKSELQSLWESNINRKNDNYTSETWNNFQNALLTAKAILDKTDANQGEITNAYNALLASISSLKKSSSGGKGSGTKPSDDKPTTSLPGCKSDTTNDLTVNGAYQFKITSTNGSVPNFVIGTPGVFKTELVSHNGNDYFYKVTAIGKAGQKAGVYVNGGSKLLVLTVGNSAKSTPNCISDTTDDLTVHGTYQFKIISTNGSVPNFVIGTPGVFKTELASHNGNDYFYKVTAIGKAGQKAGVYVNGGSKLLVLTVG